MKKTNAKIPKKKLNVVKELTELINSKRTILIADIRSIPGSQFQQIAKKIRGKAIVKVPKKNLFLRALNSSKKEKTKELMNSFNGAVAILFSDLDSYGLAGELLKIKSPSKAKPGQIAPKDLEVPEGPTELVPGPAISELGALGIQIMIQGGKIEIKAPKIVAQEGNPISQKAADILSKLNILPFSIGFIPLSAYDSVDDLVYVNIEVDPEKAKISLSDSVARAFALAVSIGFIDSETIKIMIRKAVGQEKRLIKVINGEPEEVVNIVNDEKALSAGTIKKEEKKEANTDFAASFF